MLIAYAGQPGAIDQLLDAMPKGNTNQELTMHYLYALRTITAGWTTDQKERLAEVLGRTSRWRGGLSYASVLAQYFEAFDPLYTSPEEKAILYARAPDFAPLTPEELAAPVAGRGGGGGGAPSARREADGKPADEQGRDVRRSDLHRARGAAERRGGPRDLRSQRRGVPSDGGVGNNHGVTALDLTASARTVQRRDLARVVMFPSRQVLPISARRSSH